jgi:protein TIF31
VRDRKLVQDASTFLLESVVPRFVHDCIQLVVTPMDGEALSAAMHARGINMRYLGRIAALASLRDDLHHIKVGVVPGAVGDSSCVRSF